MKDLLGIQILPYDCTLEVFEYLKIRDLFEKVILVSREFYNLVHTPRILKSKLVDDLEYYKYFKNGSLSGKFSAE
jgi:hypothetical protein